MKRNTWFNLLLILGLVLALGGSASTARRALAQVPGPEGQSSIQAAVGDAFTYQGRLLDSDTPVNGTCDFRFNLYDDAWDFPSLVAGPVDRGSVTVSDGYFSASLDFGSNAFTGEGRQLEILVRCPAGSGSYTTLSGMVTLSAAPYAHSLRPGAVISGSIMLGAVVKAENTYSGGMLASYGLHGVSQDTGVLGTGGNTGVYGKTNSPTGHGVYSDGDAHVEGDLTWKAKTSYVSVAATAFHPMVDGYDYKNQGHTLWNNDGSSDDYAAPVQLPHGATVTKLTFYWWDGSLVNGHCTLYRTNMTNSEVVMAEAWTSGDAVTSDFSQDDTIVYATVDNSQYTYYLYWELPDMVVAGHGVVIEYTFTEPY